MQRKLAIASVTAAVLAVGGTATALAVGTSSPHSGAARGGQKATGRSSVSVPGDGPDEDAREAAAAKVSPRQAVGAARSARKGGDLVVTGVDLDQDRPGLVWDVDLVGRGSTSHEIVVDAGTGRVLADRADGHDDDAVEARARLKGTSVDAVEAARAAGPHGKVTSVEVDDDHGTKALWKAETVTPKGTQHDVLVDARTGKVVGVTVDDANDDD